MRRFLPVLVYYFYRTLTSLWRIRLIEHPEMSQKVKDKSPLILAHWHGDEYSLFHLIPRYGLATMTSTSKDGQVVDYVIRRLGGTTSRGSSTRRAVSALIGLVRLCRRGHIVSMAVDGPRGPIHKPKPGVFELSKLCHAPIVPVGVAAAPVFVFKKSWNQAFLPLPFAKVVIYMGKPLPCLQKEDDPNETERANELSKQLIAAGQQAANFIAAT